MSSLPPGSFVLYNSRVAAGSLRNREPEGQHESSPGRQPEESARRPARVNAANLPVKETSASLSCPSWMLSLSDLELPRERFMFRKYWPQRCRPASFFSLFSLARRFWNHTCGGRDGEWPPGFPRSAWPFWGRGDAAER